MASDGDSMLNPNVTTMNDDSQTLIVYSKRNSCKGLDFLVATECYPLRFSSLFSVQPQKKPV